MLCEFVLVLRTIIYRLHVSKNQYYAIALVYHSVRYYDMQSTSKTKFKHNEYEVWSNKYSIMTIAQWKKICSLLQLVPGQI